MRWPSNVKPSRRALNGTMSLKRCARSRARRCAAARSSWSGSTGVPPSALTDAEITGRTVLGSSPLDRLGNRADTRPVAGSLYSNRGAKRAREARLGLGGDAHAPLNDVLETIEALGDVHVVVLELADGVAGAYIARPDRPLLLVNGTQAITRQRFTLAHEFGHFRMGHASVVDELAAIGGYQHEPNEVSANAFAAEFLMPKAGTMAWGELHVNGEVTLEHVVRFAAEYGVSPQAARYAFETSKLLTDEARCDTLDTEIADELHIELAEHLRLEPLDDSLADAAGRLPRLPRALEDSALGDLLVGSIGVDELATRTGHTVDTVRAMLVELNLDQLLPA